MNMFSIARKLRKAGVLGINQRNAEFTLVYNDRCRYPLVDDKARTKLLAEQSGIAVPELYGMIEIERQVRDLPAIVEPYSDFVIKPARGSGGSGILVIAGHGSGQYRLINGDMLSESDLHHHVSNILNGAYSLGGQLDKALIEYRVHFDQVFRHIAFRGIPDIRIIVFLGVPIMAMVRLPTSMSDGKANLHKGAIGAGIDIASGKTLTAVIRNEIITKHPDTENSVTDVQVPNWDSLLDIASRCYELTGLGYQGVDIVLDEKLGPLMLEINARPGLNIQIANRAGLLLRLHQVQQNLDRLRTTEQRIDFARQHFAHVQ